VRTTPDAGNPDAVAEYDDGTGQAHTGSESSRSTVAEFERTVDAMPAAVAIEAGARRLSYLELDQRANRLAHHLLGLGVSTGDIVGILAQRGPETIAAALAVLKAGAAYAPLDPDSPAIRLSGQIDDLRARVALAPSELAGRLASAAPEARVIALDEDWHEFASQDHRRVDVAVAPSDLMVVISTSGSTGRPKAVAIEHGSVLNVLDTSGELAPSLQESSLQVCVPQFDLGAYEIWATLLRGGRLVCHPPGRLDPADVCATIVEHGVRWAGMATGIFHMVAEHGPAPLAGMRVVLVGGEQLLPRYVRRFRSACPGVRLFNVYAPTETTIFSTVHEVSAEDEHGIRVPVGRAIGGARLAVRDADGSAVPRGQRGELYIGGPGVARGYLHAPELTAERFVEDPEAGRAYRTGDVVLERPDGELEMLGRIDDQVKIRGYRVEPGEVESQLAAHPSVRRAAVVSREAPPGYMQLVAYVVLADPQMTDVGLRAHLAERLPDYMVPSAFVALDRMPLTTRSKVDHRALPPPASDGMGEPLVPLPTAAPPTDLAISIGKVFADVLGLVAIRQDDDFFALGGSSLLAMQALARLRERHALELPLAAIFEASSPQALAVRAAADPSHEHLLLPPLLPVRPLPASVPTTAGQAKALLIGALADESLPYQSQAVHRIFGRLDPAALERALAALVRRHEILRTSFHRIEGTWVQRVHESPTVRLPLVDLGGAGDRERSLSDYAADAFRVRLDPERAPAANWSLVRLTDTEHALICLEHHAIHDGVSTALFLEELAIAYTAELEGRRCPLPPLEIQYRDFALWQAGLATTRSGTETLSYWQRQLAGAPAELPLVLDHPRPARQTYRGEALRRALPTSLAADLARRAKHWGATTFMVMLAAHCELMGRYAGVEELVVGSGLANRRTLASEQLLGMVVNTVALRIDLGGELTVRESVQRVRETLLGAQAHQDVPFEQVVEHLGPSRSASAAPLYQTLFSFHDAPVRTLQLPGAVLVPGDAVDNGSAKADLNVVVINRRPVEPPGVDAATYRRVSEDGLTVVWEYNGDLFSRSSAVRMLGHYERMLEQFAAGDGERAVRRLPLAATGERERVLALAGPVQHDRPQATVAEVFASRAREQPDAPAVSYEGETFTYWQLERRANRLANRLRSLGVARGSRTAVCLERSVDLIVALLAVTKAGGAYVPLDPGSPPARLRVEIEQLGIGLVLTHARHRDTLPGAPVKLVCLDDSLDLAREPDTAPRGGAAVSDPIYVMSTSGSTGPPKAVEVPHRAVIRLVCGTDYVRLTPEETLLGLAPPAFDAATFEVWGALLNGCRLVLAPPGPVALTELEELVSRERISTMWLTAGLFHRVVDDRPDLLAGVRQLLAGGDVLSPDHVRRALRTLPPDAVLLNGYGPTEGTTFTCVHRMAPGETVEDPVPIGRPIAGTRVYVLDGAGALAPLGVPGELWIGGDGVALGYVGDPALTAERFRDDPFAARPGARMYRSGDRARWRDDGLLEFLGRRDRQLKVRGFRVEPAEVETALRGHPDVQDAHVAPYQRDAGERGLAAHIVARPGAFPTDRDLRAHAGATLPAYAVPTAWSRLDRIPLSASGKIDPLGLPAPRVGVDPVRTTRRTVSADRFERQIAAIWERVLERDGVGPDDDFFDLGGHSLLAVELFDAIERSFGRQLPLATIFETPTVRGLAKALREDGWGRSRGSLVRITATGIRPPLFLVAAGDGNSVGFGALARRLGPDQPLYAFQQRGINGGARLHLTVERMAAHYLRSIRRIQRSGPYLLGGRCLGAPVAYEIARHLEERGERVALLAVLDSGGPRWRTRVLADGTPFDDVMNTAVRRSQLFDDVFSTDGTACLLRWLAEPIVGGAAITRYLYELYRTRPDVRDAFPDLDGSDAARLIDWVWRYGRREHELCESLLPVPIETVPAAADPPPRGARLRGTSATAWRVREFVDLATGERRSDAVARRIERVRDASLAAWESYLAGPYGGVITLIRSEEYRVHQELDHWHGIDAAGVVEVHVPGTHRSMMREPDVAGLAACIGRLVDDACE
jgi:amino acid adenylation domain-containing protein